MCLNMKFTENSMFGFSIIQDCFELSVTGTPLFVLGDSVYCQLIESSETFCEFCRTLIVPCSKAAFLNMNIL